MLANRRSWRQDKAQADQYTSLIKQHLGAAFVVEAEMIEDQQENTDYRYLIHGTGSIAARIRNVTDYWNVSHGIRWGEQFTIRSSRPSGVLTELHKMLHGWGDYFYYGWGNPGPPLSIPAYTILRLEIIRNWINLLMVPSMPHPWFQANPPWHVKTNMDGTQFWTVPLRNLPEEAIVRRVLLPQDYPWFQKSLGEVNHGPSC
jgi:hypothetical protein